MRTRGFLGLLIMAMLLAGGLCLPQWVVRAEGLSNSRLSQLIKRKSSLYLPSRLLLGQDNKFIIQAPAGSQVILYLSPEGSGGNAPNGRALRIGAESEQVKGLVPEKGVLELTVPIPKEDGLEGKAVFVEAVTWKHPAYEDLEVLELMDPTGRPATENSLAIAKPVNTKGALVLPSAPGMPSQLIQRITTMSELQNADARKKELIDIDGERSQDILMDRNTFMNRPGSFQQTRF